jgi:hypothetical protein
MNTQVEQKLQDLRRVITELGALVRRPPGLTDRGSHELKEMSTPVTVFGLDPTTTSTY